MKLEISLTEVAAATQLMRKYLEAIKAAGFEVENPFEGISLKELREITGPVTTEVGFTGLSVSIDTAAVVDAVHIFESDKLIEFVGAASKMAKALTDLLPDLKKDLEDKVCKFSDRWFEDVETPTAAAETPTATDVEVETDGNVGKCP